MSEENAPGLTKPSPADGNSAQLQVKKERKMQRSDFWICLSPTDIELLSNFSVILELVENLNGNVAVLKDK